MCQASRSGANNNDNVDKICQRLHQRRETPLGNPRQGGLWQWSAMFQYILYISVLNSWSYLANSNSYSSENRRAGEKIQQNACLESMTLYYIQSKEPGHLVQLLAYAYNCQYHRSTAEILFSLVLSRHPPGPTKVDSLTALPPNADIPTYPAVLQKPILALLAATRTKVSETLAQRLARYKLFFDRRVRSILAFKVGQTVYVNRPLSIILLADRQTSIRYNKLMLRTTGSFKALMVRDHVLTNDDNGITNSISIDRVTPVDFQHCHRVL